MPGFLFSKVQRSLVVFRKAGTTVSAPSQPAAATPGAILAIVVTIFFAIVVPESPKWLYTWEHFDESKENLAYVGKSNGMQEERVARIRNLTFDLEQLEK